MGVRLPAEYQEVEYISGTGTQYIDSGIECTSDLIVDFEFSTPNTENKAICGGIKSLSKNNHFRHHCTPISTTSVYGFYWCQISQSDRSSIGHPYQTNVRYKTYVNPVNGTARVNGSEYTFQSLVSNETTGKNYGILGRISSTGLVQAKASTFYYFKFYRNDALIGDFVPCYRKADSEPGMYDLVTNQFFTNAGTGEFLVGPDVIDSISPLMVAWRRAMMAAASVAKKLVKLIATSTTGLVGFDTNVEMPTKVTCEFSPVQEGTGDPSPDNVRPISGWTGCEIRHFYQLFDENSGTIERKYYSNNGRIMDDDGVITTRIYTQYIPVSPNTMYTIHGDSNDLAYIRVVEFNSIQTFATRTLSSHIQNPSITIRTTSQTRYLRINPDTSVSNIFVYETNAATTTSLPITFTDPSTGDPLTVYGGTVTLNEDGSADLGVSVGYAEITGGVKKGTSSTYYSDDTTYAYISIGFAYDNTTGYTIDGAYSNWLRSYGGAVWNHTEQHNIYGAHTRPSTGNIALRVDNSVIGATAEDTIEERVEKFNTYLSAHPLQICAKLATPQTYHFDNVGQLKSFLGTNNIWHDMNGSITAEYYNKQ